MIWETNTVRVDADQAAAFEAAFADAAVLLKGAEGCEAVELLRCVEIAGRYQVRVRWRALTDHVDTYPMGIVAPRVRALVSRFIREAEPLHYVVAL